MGEHIKASLESWVGAVVEVPAQGCPRASGLTDLLTQIEWRYNVGIYVASVSEDMGEAWQDAMEVNVSTAVKVTVSGFAESEVNSARSEAFRIAAEKLRPWTGHGVDYQSADTSWLPWRDRGSYQHPSRNHPSRSCD